MDECKEQQIDVVWWGEQGGDGVKMVATNLKDSKLLSGWITFNANHREYHVPSSSIKYTTIIEA